MLRSVVGAVAVATAVSLGPVPGPALASAQALERSDPVDGLPVHPEWGSITGKSGVLKRSCRTYTYSYSINPPEGIWALEVFISGPGLEHLAAGVFIDGYDPTTGTGRYTLCKATTRYGRFTIRAKVSTDNGSGEMTEGQLPPDTFRLRRPGR